MIIDVSGTTVSPSCRSGILAIGQSSVYALMFFGRPSSCTPWNLVSVSYSASSTFQQYEDSGWKCRVSAGWSFAVISFLLRQGCQVSAQPVEPSFPFGASVIDPLFSQAERGRLDRTHA